MEETAEQVTEKQPVITDKMRNDKWDSMLKVFEAITKGSPEPSKVAEKLKSLSDSALNTNLLTPRQREGIVDRCRNYLKGGYGVDAVKDAYVPKS